MFTNFKKQAFAALCGIALVAGASSASALTVKFTISNNSAPGGVTLTPLYLGLHDGSFDAFDVGSAASAGVELLAEDGDFSAVAAERLAVAPNSQGGAIFGPLAPNPPVLLPGQSNSVELQINANQNSFLTYLSMILPSNDQFIGNDDALALFDGSGNFLGDQVIEVTGADVYDAGTEENTGFGAPFNANGGVATDTIGGVITQGPGISEFFGVETAAGFTVDPSAANFAGSKPFSVATITITAVPVPAALPLLASAFGIMGFVAHRRRKTA